MTVPNLKRIRISDLAGLRTWLTKNPNQLERVMIVTHKNQMRAGELGQEHIAEVLSDFGWMSERRYTLSSNLIGKVIGRR